MVSYRKFNFNTIAVILFTTSFFGLFNVAVDPFGIMGSPEINRVNKLKTAKEDHERLYKAIDVERLQPKILFLGNSRVHRALDPHHSALVNANAYNLAFPAATMYEQRRYLEYALMHQKDLKMVIIGADFGMFNSSNKTNPGFSEERINQPEMRLQELLGSNFSIDTFYSSVKTILFNTTTKDLGNNDQNNDQNIDDELYQRNSSTISQRVPFTNFIGNFLQKSKQLQLSNEALNNLKILVNTCQQNGITVKVFIPPPHATQTEAIRVAGLWPMYERWQRELVKITPFWDFSGYNSVTTEPISDNMKNYHDSSHAYKEVGDLMLNKILNYQEERVPADFGILVTPENVESHLVKISVDRQVWAKNNPSAVKLVENLSSTNKKQNGSNLKVSDK